MDGWQPIETAPKDGSYIVAGKFTDQALGWVRHSRWITEVEICDLEGWGEASDFIAAWTSGNDDGEPCYPTHWMPLPTPPAPTLLSVKGNSNG